jgi:flagellar biosynthesis/type III secretory pathway M-ring protein FliF/YscJ
VTVGTTGVTATTDAQGKFNVTVAVGAYDVTIKATDYDDYTKNGVQVSLNKTTSISVTLSKSKGKVKGKVTDKDSGDPIYMAMVSWGEGLFDNDFTDENGDYEVELEVGEYTFSCEAISGYNVPDSKKVTVKANQDTTLNFELEPKAVYLVVKVVKIDMLTPIKGAKVTLAGGTSKTTGDNGTVTFMDLEKKVYTVTVTKGGYKKATSDVDLSSGAQVLTQPMLSQEEARGIMALVAGAFFLICILPILIIVIIIVVIVVMVMKRRKKKAAAQQAAAPPPQQQQQWGQQPPQGGAPPSQPQQPQTYEDLYGTPPPQQQQQQQQWGQQPPPQY